MVTRGIRNNNPFNIRKGDNWKGLSAKQTDKSFCQFDDVIFGIRACFKVLDTYINKHNLSTVKEIITRFAPSNENNTSGYIKAVCDLSGLNPDSRVIFRSDVMFDLMCAMAFVESSYRLTLVNYHKAQSLL